MSVNKKENVLSARLQTHAHNTHTSPHTHTIQRDNKGS